MWVFGGRWERTAVSQWGFWVMKPYYETDNGVLYQGDCLEVMPGLKDGSVDLVITDPPYGINHSSGHGASWANTTIAGDADTSIRDSVLSRFSSVASFGTWKTPPIENTRGVIVWDKGPAFGMGDLSFPFKPSWEMIFIKGPGWYGKRDEGVWRGPVVVSWESKGRVHPHQKPVSLIAYLLTKHDGKLIMDPFIGSGTTAIACERLNRKWIGIEISEEYCEIAAKRIERETRQGSMFG